MSEQTEQPNSDPTNVPEKKDTDLDTNSNIVEDNNTDKPSAESQSTETIKSPSEESEQTTDEPVEDLTSSSVQDGSNKESVVPKKSNWGGKREGAGRKFGTVLERTKEKRAVKQEFKNRVMKNAHVLFNAQLNLARGCSFLFKIEETGEGRTKKRNHILVTEPEEIRAYLDGEVDDGYYYMTTKSPDNRALDSLLDRTFGRATQGIEVDANINVSKFSSLDDKQIDEQIEQLESNGGDAPDTEGGEAPEAN